MRKKIFCKIEAKLSNMSIWPLGLSIWWGGKYFENLKQSKAKPNMSIWPPYSVYTVQCTNLPRQHLRSFLCCTFVQPDRHTVLTQLYLKLKSPYTIVQLNTLMQMSNFEEVALYILSPDTRQLGAVDTLDSFCRLDRRFWHGHNFLDAIASPSTYPRACQSVGEWVSESVSDSFRLEIAIASKLWELVLQTLNCQPFKSSHHLHWGLKMRLLRRRTTRMSCFLWWISLLGLYINDCWHEYKMWCSSLW